MGSVEAKRPKKRKESRGKTLTWRKEKKDSSMKRHIVLGGQGINGRKPRKVKQKEIRKKGKVKPSSGNQTKDPLRYR